MLALQLDTEGKPCHDSAWSFRVAMATMQASSIAKRSGVNVCLRALLCLPAV